MLSLVKRNTFRKPEKICNQNQIDTLFKEGKSLKSGLFRLLVVENDEKGKSPVQVLIAVPKKNLRHAVDRNRMKRLIREAYRLNKHKILDKYAIAYKHLDIAFIFLGKQPVSQAETVAAINVLLDRLINIHEENPE
ncbi:MAG: ribonuclease P protein component [Lentimicrobiaceae bacterium]|jgi:ribonuclease P protein component